LVDDSNNYFLWGVYDKIDKNTCFLISPEFDSWSHSEKTMEEKMQQWIACGGNSCGSYEFFGDSPYIRMFRQPETCMFDMGYNDNYIRLCIESSSSFCKEANLDKFPPYAEYEPWKPPHRKNRNR